MANPNLKPPLPVRIGPYVGTLRIHHDERGVAWIDDSNIKVVEVILDHVQGKSPEQIHETHPHLSLVQIHAAIAYYYDHKQEVDDLMREWRERYEAGYNQPESAAWRERMRARAALRSPQKEEVAA
jgi:uncharacterized protein (DUF433 family)